MKSKVVHLFFSQTKLTDGSINAMNFDISYTLRANATKEENYRHVFLRFVFDRLSERDRDRFWHYVYESVEPRHCTKCKAEEAYEGTGINFFSLSLMSYEINHYQKFHSL